MQEIISIITPLYNRYDLVQETWKSIEAQTYLHWEWIVVDDGSTDEGPQFIQQLREQDKRVNLYFRTTGTKGPSACRNLGVNHALGRYLLFFDSDDLITPDCLEKRVQYLENKPNLNFAVFTQALFSTNTNEHTIFSKFYSTNDEYLKAFIADKHPWCISGPIWQKESFLNLGGFREDYAIMEDPELHIRALLANMQFDVINDAPDFFYRQTAKTKEQEERFWENSIKGRIVFYENLTDYLKQLKKIDCYKQSLSEGIKILFKKFLLARVKNYKVEFIDFYRYASVEKLLTLRSRLLIQLYYRTYHNKLLSSIPYLKGILYKFL